VVRKDVELVEVFNNSFENDVPIKEKEAVRKTT
jgi:hypothetical protein